MASAAVATRSAYTESFAVKGRSQLSVRTGLAWLRLSIIAVTPHRPREPLPLASIQVSHLPEGTVTFLFTDVEGSTRLWEDAPEVMMDALRLHDEAIDAAVEAHGGVSVKPRGEGDSRFVVFRSAKEAVHAVAEIQRRLTRVEWPTPRPIRVRASLHSGPAQLELGDYYGSTVNRAARLRAIAHGGQTLISGATHDLVQDHIADDLAVTDMGWHRLKDLTRPEHVFQLDVKGISGEFPPLKSLDAVPNNLPEQVTELIGREAEIEQMEELLRDNRLVTVLAPGGTGKTHLSIQAAANLTADYPDGVYFIALADISSSEDIVQTVAETVGVALSSSEDPRTQLLEYLAPRTLLLIFDNFEHVAEGAEIVAAILEAAPSIDVIATSRSRLQLSGEATLLLEGLDTGRVPIDEAPTGSGAQLFIDSARRIQPNISFGEEDLASLGEILRLTDGMPLGILLASAWVDMLSIPDIAAEISKNIDFLESTVVDMPDRHRSVRAVFEYSWDLLSATEQRTFAALSIFRGGFTREAAGAVAGASLRDLAGLARKSLLRADPETGRYSVHELLRQFAERELTSDTERHSEVLHLHAAYYTDMARKAFESFHSPDQGRMMETLEPDLDNVRLAWRHHIEVNDSARLCQMVGAIWCAYELRGWYHAGLALLNPALQHFQGREETSDRLDIFRARALAVHAAFSGVLGHFDTADTNSESALSVAHGVDDPESFLLASHLRAQTLLYLNRTTEIPPILNEVIAFAEGPAGDSWEIGRYWAAGLKNIEAFALIVTGDTDNARRLLDESRERLEPLGDLFYMAWNYGHRARLAIREGRFDDAVDLFSRSADRARRLGSLRTLHVALFGLGDATLTAGDPIGAQRAFVESLSVAERTGMVPEMLATIVRIAETIAANGEEREAVQMLAMVEAEPDSVGQFFTQSESIKAAATNAMGELESTFDEAEVAELVTSGAQRNYRTVVKQLAETLNSSLGLNDRKSWN
jgi:predicted ATPase/class 3 adenylate cyclase